MNGWKAPARLRWGLGYSDLCFLPKAVSRARVNQRPRLRRDGMASLILSNPGVTFSRLSLLIVRVSCDPVPLRSMWGPIVTDACQRHYFSVMLSMGTTRKDGPDAWTRLWEGNGRLRSPHTGRSARSANIRVNATRLISPK